MSARTASFHQRIRRIVTSILLISFLSLLGYWALLYAMQDSLLYPGTQLGLSSAKPFWSYAQRLTVSCPDGPVYAWLLKPRVAGQSSAMPLVVFFHGNYELASDQAGLAEEYLDQGWAILVPEYRGFGDSAGKPGQSDIRQDAIGFLDQVAAMADINPQRIVYHGRSLGGAVAGDLSMVRKPAAMILESTFHSGPAMVHRFFAPGWLMKNPYRSDRAVAAFDGPILLIHGRNDRTIPFDHAQRLMALAKPGQATLLELPGDHNDIPGGQAEQAQYWQAIGHLLERAK